MWAFLISPLGRKLALSVVVLSVVAGFALYFYNRGKTDGYKAGQSVQLATDKQQFEQILGAYQGQLAAGQQREAQAMQLLAQAQASLDRANSRLDSVRAQAEKDKAQVAALPDDKLFVDIRAKVGQVPVTDPAQTFYPVELRQIDSVVTDYPNVKNENAALGEKVTALDQKVTALGNRIDAISSERDAAVAYSNQVTGYYVKAYNAAQKKHSLFVKIITFGLVHDQHLALPDPITLQR